MRVVQTADAVSRLDIETDPVAFLEYHRRRPDLDFDLHNFARLQIEPALVPVIGR
jgi:hypothetical protein